LAKKLVPAEAYTFFIDILLDTIRDEIAGCIEKSYKALKPDAAAKVLNMTPSQLQTYAKKVRQTFYLLFQI
jgi:26S proteasome regulatory subunit N12